MWVSMCFPRAVDSYFIVKKRPYSLAKIATRGVRPGYSFTHLASHCKTQGVKFVQGGLRSRAASAVLVSRRAEDRRFGAQQTQRYRATALGEQDYSDTSELVDEGVERARDGRLEEHPRDGDHGEAAVGQLLHLHVLDLRLRLALEHARAKAVVADDVVGVIAEDDPRAQSLGDGDRDCDLAESNGRDLVLRLERVERDVLGPVDRQLAKQLGEDEAHRREHRLPPVHQLRLAHIAEIAAELDDRGRDAERIETDIANHRAVQRRRLLQEGNGR
mmetsp:Transcript_39801/g.125754  ORF Transcript_39801/g.125754 Transcript_39801/m.125754 type:complete len:274 (-) Transcript_39801:177-998(-)